MMGLDCAVVATFQQAGIEEMQIYIRGTRMFMIMDVNESFSLGALMWNFQRPC